MSRPAGNIDRARLDRVQVVFEDHYLIAFNKPAGIAVHPGAGARRRTLVDIVNRATQGTDLSPGIAHRLDRETSGLVIFGKRPEVTRKLGTLFEKGKVKKIYVAVLKGRVPPKGILDQPLLRKGEEAAQTAVTSFRLIRFFGGFSLVEASPETGRFHQIRRHFAQIGHPVIGDDRYGDFSLNRTVAERFGLKRQFLHAYSIRLRHPVTGNDLHLQAPLPEDLLHLLERYGIKELYQ